MSDLCTAPVEVGGVKLKFMEYLKSIFSTDQEIQVVLETLKSIQDSDSEKILVGVDGPQLATGKTTLVRVLREMGIDAVEEHQTYHIALTKRL